jgi:hypothetical protein
MKSKTKKKQSIWEPKANFVQNEKRNGLKAEDFAFENSPGQCPSQKMRSLPK